MTLIRFPGSFDIILHDENAKILTIKMLRVF